MPSSAGRPSYLTDDKLSRLLSVLHQAGAVTRDGATYNYDNASNRTSKTFVQLSIQIFQNCFKVRTKR